MKNLLIVVDFQKDFVTGSLGFAGAAELEPRIADKIRAYRSRGDEIAFTFDTHAEDYLQTQEGKFLPVTHCVKGTDGHGLCDAIEALRQPEDKCFYKPAFGSAELFDYLRGGQYGQIELVGVVTNICVISNAVLAKTALPEVPVIVDAACVGGGDAALHEKALDVMAGIQVKVIRP